MQSLLKLGERWVRFHARGFCAASFPLKLEKLEEEVKGKGCMLERTCGQENSMTNICR